MRVFYVFMLLVLLSVSCTEGDQDNETEYSWYKPVPDTTFDWDLRSDIPESTSYNAVIVDIDAFDNTKEFVDLLHSRGQKVFAYVSVGSWEDWRPDAGDFPGEVIGNDYPGWEGEKFLDIRRIDLLAPVMQARFDMIKEKGFDGIEPDNIDLHSWTSGETGFDISADDVITYSQWLSEQAHNRGLSIGQKNAADLSADLVNYFDWILTEDAFYEGTQNEAQIYVEKNKAVFAVEYTDMFTENYLFTGQVCQEAAQLHYTAILKHRELDDFTVQCP